MTDSYLLKVPLFTEVIEVLGVQVSTLRGATLFHNESKNHSITTSYGLRKWGSTFKFPILYNSLQL